MVHKLNVKLILELREKGLNRTHIAESRHISGRLVNEVCKIAQEKNISYADIAAKTEDEVYKLFYLHKYEYLNEDFMRVRIIARSIPSCGESGSH